MSYNPSVLDHSNLLQAATLVELRKEKAALKWKRRTLGMFPTAGEALTEEEKLLELAEGLFEEEEEEEKEGAPAGEKKETDPETSKAADDGDKEEEEEEVVYKPPIR
jgi:hypothetical protein